MENNSFNKKFLFYYKTHRKNMFFLRFIIIYKIMVLFFLYNSLCNTNNFSLFSSRLYWITLYSSHLQCLPVFQNQIFLRRFYLICLFENSFFFPLHHLISHQNVLLLVLLKDYCSCLHCYNTLLDLNNY